MSIIQIEPYIVDATANFVFNSVTATGNLTVSGLVTATGNVIGNNIAGVIRPTSGNGTAGIIFPADPGGGSSDTASIKYYSYSGEDAVLEVRVTNDATDYILLNASGGTNVASSLTSLGTF